MQADALADDQGRDHHRLEPLADADGQPYPEQPGKIIELHQGGERREDQPCHDPDVGNDDRDAGQDADRQRELQPCQP
jgi:hypothetical protein